MHGVWQPQTPGANFNTAFSFGLDSIPAIVASIERMTLTIDQAGQHWTTVYQLDEWPYADPSAQKSYQSHPLARGLA